MGPNLEIFNGVTFVNQMSIVRIIQYRCLLFQFG